VQSSVVGRQLPAPGLLSGEQQLNTDYRLLYITAKLLI
jgi:hypothetical protein